MYIPQEFKEDSLEILHTVIRDHSFGTLVCAGSEGLVASHLPFLLDPEHGAQGTLVGHLARANGQWRSFTDDAEVLVIFQGPHAYISPSWYESELVVPTWNYVAVHVYGRPRLVEEREGLHGIVQRLVGTYEGSLQKPWSMDRLPEEFVERLSKGIVGLEIPIERIEGKFKLSQNRTSADQRGTIAGLRSQGGVMERDLADLMVTRMGGS